MPIAQDDQDRKLLADVAGHGWSVVLIPEDDEGPAFAFSIGLHHSFSHPEIILFGLSIAVMHRIINGIGEQIQAGEKFDSLEEADDVLEGYSVMFRSVERKHYSEFVGYAHWFYQSDEFPVLQCVWPNVQDRFPWHPHFPANLEPRQPVLYGDEGWPFHAGKNRAIFTTRPVIEKDQPILLVCHDREGDWQFLCGTTNRTEDCRLVCLAEMFNRHPEIGAVADLPEGWEAFRENVDSPWNREESGEDQVDAPPD